MSPFGSSSPGRRRLLGAFVLVAAVATAAAARLGEPDPTQTALRSQLSGLQTAEAYLWEAYAARDFKPMWTAFEAGGVIALLDRADEEGLPRRPVEAGKLREALLRAANSPSDRAHFEIEMSRALATYESDLRRPASETRLFVTDPLMAPPERRKVLMAAALAPDLAQHLAAARGMHPIYESFRAARQRLARLPQTAARRRLDRLLLANMDRARILPVHGRYIVVDAAAARLWLYEGTKPVATMKAVVGEPDQPTPVMAGLIRYIVFNPYWNIPPDLVRDKIAPKVLERGLKVLADDRLEVLADWSPSARTLDPSTVDWGAAVDGKQILRVRQRPGAGNMMGRVKFMFPNRLGVYLHDTSDHSVFDRAERHLSAGCVRVEDAAALSLWMGRPLPGRGAGEDFRADLPKPIPVYLSYFTVQVDGGDASPRPDPYRRDDPQR